MPGSLNGIGTTYYGRREEQDDGSYITTEWVIFAFVPILPLRSFRVRPVPLEPREEYRSRRGHDLARFAVVRVPLAWRQVFHVYVVGVAGVMAFFYVCEWLMQQ
jgi:hypothetical protein